MAEHKIIIIAVRSLPQQGEKLLSQNWQPFLGAFRRYLHRAAHEIEGSSDELLLFSCADPHLILRALVHGLLEAKKEFDWQDAYGNVPVQIVMHAAANRSEPAPIKIVDEPFWHALTHESIYITKELKLIWRELSATQQLPAYEEKGIDDAYFLLNLSKSMGNGQDKLFSHRSLLIQGDQEECFYCGMNNHPPADCPSKQLSMDLKGLEELGYLPFQEIDSSIKAPLPTM